MRQMVNCARCGREFESKSKTSIPGTPGGLLGLLYLMRYSLRAAVILSAALFMIGGLAMIGVNIYTALGNHDFSLLTLALSILFIAALILMVLLFRNLRQSIESLSHCCPDCAGERLGLAPAPRRRP